MRKVSGKPFLDQQLVLTKVDFEGRSNFINRLVFTLQIN